MNSKILSQVLRGSHFRLGVFALLFGLVVGWHVKPQVDANLAGTLVHVLMLFSGMFCVAIGVGGLFSRCSDIQAYELVSSRTLVFSTPFFFGLGFGVIHGWELGFGMFAITVVTFFIMANFDRGLAESRYVFCRESRARFHEIALLLIGLTLCAILLSGVLRIFGITAMPTLAKIVAVCLAMGTIGIAVFAAHAVQPWDNPVMVCLKAAIIGVLFGCCCLTLFVDIGAFRLGCYFGAGLTAIYHVIMWVKWIFNFEGVRELQWK